MRFQAMHDESVDQIIVESAPVALDVKRETQVDGPCLEGLQDVSSGWGRVCVVMQGLMDRENLQHLF